MGRELGKPKSVLNEYSRQAAALRSSTEQYLGANVQGSETYRYYAGNTVLRSFVMTPRLPKAWPTMKLRDVKAFGSDFDLNVLRTPDGLRIEVLRADRTISSQNSKDGASVTIDLDR